MNRYEKLCDLINHSSISSCNREQMATALDEACQQAQDIIHGSNIFDVQPLCPVSVAISFNEIRARLDGIDERLGDLERRRDDDTL